MKDQGTPEQQMKRAYQERMGGDPTLFQVERFEKQGILDIDHAVAGKRLYVWHFAAVAGQSAKAIDMSREVFGGHGGDVNLDKPVAADRYFKTMTQVRKAENATGKPYGKILRAVCLDEMGMDDLRVHVGARRDAVRAWMIEAFDMLVEAQHMVFELDKIWREKNNLQRGG